MSLLEGVNPSLLSGAVTVVKKLYDQGHKAYFAGGAVRDLLLGNTISDIDIVTCASPQKIEQLFSKTISVGKKFGVMIVVVDSINYEVATFRQESGYGDGRHPSKVSFTDKIPQDAERRDFTVNAIFLNPLTEELIDFVQGKQDLDSRLIRTVGSPAKRFAEDKLRVIRAVRLASQLGFEIDRETYKEIQVYASQVLPQVSWERIRDELLKILTGPHPADGIQLLLDSGILQAILPEIADMKGVEQPPEFHPEGDVFTHTCLMLGMRKGLDDILALSILLHDVGKPPTFSVKERIRFDGHADVGAKMAEDICRRLRLSTEQIDNVVDLVKDHLRFIHVQEMRDSKLKRFLGKENFQKHLELHRLDCLASHGDLSSYHFCLQKLDEIGQEELKPDPLINGRDLLSLNLKPGPLFSEILMAVEDLQLEGELDSKKKALDWVKQNYIDG